METIQLTSDVLLEVWQTDEFWTPEENDLGIDQPLLRLRKLGTEGDQESGCEIVIQPLEYYPMVEQLEEVSGTPLTLTVTVTDDRLKGLIGEVWHRLPTQDRHMIRNLVSQVFDNHLEREEALAYVAPAYLDRDGSHVAEVAQNISRTVWLGRAKEIESDAACMYVIAHEFAHVVLRHAEISAVARTALDYGFGYTHAGLAKLQEWHEDAATLQAWLWGFQDEFAAFLDEYPEAPRPKWYVELEWQEITNDADLPGTTEGEMRTIAVSDTLALEIDPGSDDSRPVLRLLSKESMGNENVSGAIEIRPEEVGALMNNLAWAARLLPE